MKYEAYSNHLYEIERFGERLLVPEILHTKRYKGKSLKNARKSILPLQPGCSGVIKLNGNEFETHIRRA